LVVFAGCQDLGDYPDYPAPKTTTPGTTNGDRPSDIIPIGGRTINGTRDFSCIAGDGIDILIEITDLPVKLLEVTGLPNGMRVSIVPTGDPPVQSYRLRGVPTVPGRYHIGVSLYNRNGDNWCWVTLTVVAGRQAVSQ